MTASTADVVVVGAGVAGIASAYYLGKRGIKCVIVERDAVGSHASGFAYGGLSALDGIGVHRPSHELARLGMRLHRELAGSLPEQTGIDVEFRDRPSLTLCFTDEERKAAKASLAVLQDRDEYSTSWLGPKELSSVESRISALALGAVYVRGTADLEPHKFVLALAQAAEDLGATMRHGTVEGLRRRGEQLTGVVLGSGEISCDRVVLAMGPWSGLASDWLEVPIDVRPLKGEILRLRAPGRPYGCSIGWAGNYATTKPDGLLWAGTTEEEAGFDENTTTRARDEIMAALLKMVPGLGDAELVYQTACLRPVSSDMRPVLGEVPGWKGVFIATGAGRGGILLGPAMGRTIADLIATGSTETPIGDFDPGRFGG
jgi:glycine oxidase